MNHIPVLLNECVEALDIQPNGIYVDATYGGGGHAREIIALLNDQGKLIAFDQDENAIDRIIKDDRFLFINENFKHLKRFLRFHNIHKVDGILADLGMSSFQLDSEKRGFSTRFDAELDMRMSNSISKTAGDILNNYPEEQLKEIFQNYGEIRNSKSLAKKIIAERTLQDFTSTNELIRRINDLIIGNRNRYLAQLFQALRIEVNQEMDALREFLSQSVGVLNQGGRLAIITFHSLEDRLVKRFFKTGNFDGTVKKDLYGNFHKPLQEIYRKPIIPTNEEIKKNKRARSAKLRIAMRNKEN